jgi:hypothetical protein
MVFGEAGVSQFRHIRPQKRDRRASRIPLREEDLQSDYSLQAIDRRVAKRQPAGGWTAPIELDQNDESQSSLG